MRRIFGRYAFLLIAFGCASTTDRADGEVSQRKLNILADQETIGFQSRISEGFRQATSVSVDTIVDGVDDAYRNLCDPAARVDFVASSRPMTANEKEVCSIAGLGSPVSMSAGFDAMVLIAHQSSPLTDLEPEELFRGLTNLSVDRNAAGHCSTISQTVSNWRQVASRLPQIEIRIIGADPTSSSPLRLSEVTKLASREFDCASGLELGSVAGMIRTDGRARGVNQAQLFAALRSDRNSIGVLRWSDSGLLPTDLKRISVSGVVPGKEEIYSLRYKLSQQAHLTGVARSDMPIKTRDDYKFHHAVSVPTRVWVRPDAAKLSTSHAAAAAYRNAVTNMRARPSSDPTSWSFQANKHGTFDPKSNATERSHWDACNHDDHFLAWHRMYLYYFERIVRRASGDPDFALPYWDYSNPQNVRAAYIPEMFLKPADEAENSLFRNARTAALNRGERSLPPGSVSLARPLSAPNYTSFQFSVDAQPHGPVHVSVGGRGASSCTDSESCCRSGLMSCFETAAQDPIFWTHHAQIDRIWELWLKAPHTGGGNPSGPEHREWLETSFSFFDEYGREVRLSGAEILNTVNDLGYRYEDETLPHGLAQRADEETPLSLPTAVSSPEERAAIYRRTDITLADAQPSIRLDSAPDRAEFSADDQDIAFILGIDGISAELPTGDYYEVYVNPPLGEDLTFESPYFVGNLAIFSGRSSRPREHAHHQLSRHFDITGLVRSGVIDASRPESLRLEFRRVSFDVETDIVRPTRIQSAEIFVRERSP